MRAVGLGLTQAGAPRARSGTILAGQYANRVQTADESRRDADPPETNARDHLAVPEAVLHTRQRSMAERLDLALSWDSVAAELRAGLAKVTGRSDAEQS